MSGTLFSCHHKALHCSSRPPTRGLSEVNRQKLAHLRAERVGRIRGARRAYEAAMGVRPMRWTPISRSDGTVGAASVGLIHFVAQTAFTTDVPSIFHPHDLQHVHLPGNFTRLQRWLDDSLRRELARKGRERVRAFTWERTAKHFRAHYRRIAGRELDAADRALLSAPPLL